MVHVHVLVFVAGLLNLVGFFVAVAVPFEDLAEGEEGKSWLLCLGSKRADGYLDVPGT